MKYQNYVLKTAFDIGYELDNAILYGKKVTRNICEFNVTMHFKQGVCKVKINNIEKINCMVYLQNRHRNINFNNFGMEQANKLEYILGKIKKEITKEFYDTTYEVSEYLMDDLRACSTIAVFCKQ